MTGSHTNKIVFGTITCTLPHRPFVRLDTSRVQWNSGTFPYTPHGSVPAQPWPRRGNERLGGRRAPFGRRVQGRAAPATGQCCLPCRDLMQFKHTAQTSQEDSSHGPSTGRFPVFGSPPRRPAHGPGVRLIIGTRAQRVSASIGVMLQPQSRVSSADPLLRQARHARHEARQSGRNRVYVHDPAVTQQQARDTAVHRPARAAAP